jgi:S1-C subfamily serine protease
MQFKKDQLVHKIIPLFLVFLLLISIIPSNISFAAPKSVPTKISWQLFCEQPKDFNLVSKKLNEYLNIKLNVEVNFIFTSKNQQDKNIFLDDTLKNDNSISTIDIKQYYTYLNLGKLLVLDKYIDKYALKTKNILGDKILSLATENSNLFGLPIPGSDFAHASGISIDKNMVNKLKLSVAKIKKLSDIEPLLKSVKTLLPETIPLINAVSTIDYNILGLENLGDYLGAVKIGENSSTVINEFDTPEFKTYYQNINSFYKQSYLKKYDKISSPLEDKNVFAVLYDRLSPLTSDNYNIGNRLQIYLGKPIITEADVKNNLVAIKYNSKNPELCVKLIDLLNTDSYITNLLHFGIADKHYLKNVNNTISYPKGISKSNTAYPQILKTMIGNRFLDSIWDNEDPTIYKKLMDFTEKASCSLTKGFVYESTKTNEDFKKCKYIINNRVTIPNLSSDKSIIFGSENPLSFIPSLINDLANSGAKNIIDDKQTYINSLLNQGVISLVSNVTLSKENNPVNVNVNGEFVFFPTPPFIQGKVTFVYAKPFLDALGITYLYNSKLKTLTITKENSELICTADSVNITINKKNLSISTSPKIINNQFFIPLQEILKQLGIKYTMDTFTNTFTTNYDVVNEFKGNNPNNISAYSNIAVSNDFIYTCINNKDLFKIKKSDNTSKKLVSDNCSYINIKNEILYYISFTQKNDQLYSDIVSCNTDGTNRKILLKGTTTFSNLQLVGNFLYYIDEKTNNPFKMSLDGKNITKLSSSVINFLMVDKGWMYFLYSDTSTLAKMRINGSGLKVLATNISFDFTNINIVNGWIYYLGSDNPISNDNNVFKEQSTSIYKVKTDGTQNILVLPANNTVFICQENLIYYNDEIGNLYSFNDTTKEVLKISSNIGSGILNYLDGWIYIYSMVENEVSASIQIYRVKADGSIKQKFNSSGIIINVYTKGELENIGQSMPIKLQETPPLTELKTLKEIAKNKSGVVFIKIFDEEGTQLASGSGFCLSPDGIIATNYHVIDGAFSVKCSLDDGSEYDVKYVLNFNKKKDIALLQLKNAKNLPILALGNSDKMELGDDVIAIGNPMELQNTVSSGIVSGIRKILGLNYIQTTASISPGSSGGPLFNSYGEVIGITSMGISDSQNLNFAIPINELTKLFPTSKVISFNEANSFDVSINEMEANNSISTANVFDTNFDINGSFSNDSDVDFYKFEVKKKSKITFFGSFKSINSNPKILKQLLMALIDSKGKDIIKSSISSQELYDVQKISIDLEAGTYYLQMSKVNISSDLPDVKAYSVITVID